MNPFSILMFAFSGMLLAYAGLLERTRDMQLIPRAHAARVKNRQSYTGAFARILAVVALAPLGGGIYALLDMRLGLVMLLVDLALCIWIGARCFGRELQ